MERKHIDHARERGRGIPALQGSTVPAVFCDAVRIDLAECRMLFISGKLGTDADGKLVGRSMGEQTRQILENIKAIVTAEGGTMDDIVRVRVYATTIDSASVREIHEARAKYWTEGHYPASTLVRVSQLLRDGAFIEIDADAVIAKR